MTHFFRRFLALLALLVVLAACGNPVIGAGGPGKNSTPAATSTPLPGNTAADICPAELQNARGCITPHAMQTVYGVSSLLQRGFTGKGQTVVDIVSFGSPTLQQDMQVFDQTFGLPPVDLQIISPLHVPEYDPRGDKGGWAGETELDVQIIHAIAPDAKIVVLVSPVAETEGTIGLPEFRQLEQYVLDHKLGNIVSQSWGASELTLQDQQGQQELQRWNDLLQQATTQQGMTYFGSSGDNGATDFTDLAGTHLANVPTTSFAADSPWVTAVGGTTLLRNGTTVNETAWRDSGGGFSRFYKTPSYQQGLPASVEQQLSNRRGVPDVSADADPLTGLAIYLNGSWTTAGGTSASAPVWAGLMAIANQMAGHPLGFINPALYRLAASSTYAQDFRDITAGNNTNDSANVQGYSAAPGWDPVTGLGSPNAEKLIPDLIATMK
ncbi:MAG TPA: S53 family peptidase [Ktedonosporobacter sp.]|jgi:subtilase family serine protease|nr:S53 family peptidase [Ktedonosporobacter sp.]